MDRTVVTVDPCAGNVVTSVNTYRDHELTSCQIITQMLCCCGAVLTLGVSCLPLCICHECGFEPLCECCEGCCQWWKEINAE